MGQIIGRFFDLQPRATSLNTGDIVIFSRENRGASLYHASLAVRDPAFTSPPLQGVFLWELSRNPFSTFGVNFTQAPPSVQMVGAPTRVQQAKKMGFVVRVRRLDPPIRDDASFLPNLAAAHGELLSLPYDGTFENWLASARHMREGGAATDTELEPATAPRIPLRYGAWGTSVVMAILVRLGMLGRGIAWGHWDARALRQVMDGEVPWTQRGAYGREVTLGS